MTTKGTGAGLKTTETSGQTRRELTIQFNEISEPGAYYNHDTGSLYRVPAEILSLGHSPLLNIVTLDENFVTKVSDNPWVPLSKARQICCNMDFAVNF